MTLISPPKKVSRPSGGSDYRLSPVEKVNRPPMLNEWPTARERPAPLEGSSSSASGVIMLLFLVIAGAVTLGYYSISRDYLLGQVATFAAAPLALYGVWRGGVRKIATLITVIIFGAVFTSHPEILDSIVSSPIGQCAVTGAAFVVSVLVVGAVTKSLRRRWVEDRPAVQFLDRSFGALLGVAEAALVVLTIGWMTSELRPFAEQLRDRPEVTSGSISHRMATAMIQLGTEAGSGEVGEFVRKTNPIGDMPMLRDAIEELNQTGRLPGNLLNSDALQGALNGMNNKDGAGLGQFTDMIRKYEEANKSRDEAYRKLSNSRSRPSP